MAARTAAGLKWQKCGGMRQTSYRPTTWRCFVRTIPRSPVIFHCETCFLQSIWARSTEQLKRQNYNLSFYFDVFLSLVEKQRLVWRRLHRSFKMCLNAITSYTAESALKQFFNTCRHFPDTQTFPSPSPLTSGPNSGQPWKVSSLRIDVHCSELC